jgi:hypothetical protein
LGAIELFVFNSPWGKRPHSLLIRALV